jgi:hypothetical protein
MLSRLQDMVGRRGTAAGRGGAATERRTARHAGLEDGAV